MKDWFDTFPWLHYDELNGKHMSTAIDTIEPTFVSQAIQTGRMSL